MTSDWDMEFTGPIGPDTKLIADLAFESIDVVQLIVQLETNFQRKDLPFEKLLMTDGRYRDDLAVREVVGFLHRYL
jgi:acyl carrier protein